MLSLPYKADKAEDFERAVRVAIRAASLSRHLMASFPQQPDPGLSLDLGIRGVWQPQVEVLFDVRVIDTDAPSHCHRAPNAILESSSQDKKRMYKKAVEDRRGTFTPFVLFVDGLLHKEDSHFIKHMATALSSKWDKAYSITSSYIRSRLAFAGVRALSLCLRGSCTEWRSGLGFDDGAPLASFME
ncbi:hypothetical protein EMCRGX_G006438 [Ephydatia muelleri]|eukprot:Em0024g10a